MKFDGKAFARIIEEQVKSKVKACGKKPKIVSFLVGEDPASALYTKLKKTAAERVGILFEVRNLSAEVGIKKLGELVREVGAQAEVTGVMIQLPVPGVEGALLDELLTAIPLIKDVDGLRYPESHVVPPVVTAVMKILEEIGKSEKELWSYLFAVVGARGTVGKGIVEQLTIRGVEVVQVGREKTREKVGQGAVVISCVGKAGLIKGEMVKDKVIAIDVGAPSGDMTSEVYQKASVSVEVPGGVGPVTIACLMEQATKLTS